MKQIGCFVTSHGYGHATRMSAVLDSLNRRLRFTGHIFTSVPELIFQQSIEHYCYHKFLTDIGFAQKNALEIDLESTCSQLKNLVPFDDTTVNHLAEQCREMSLIVCDISPMGIAVAKKLGIPSVLIENFTWDWLYSAYQKDYRKIGPFARYFKELFNRADYHIQTEPVCNPTRADLRCGPIFRRLREDPQQIKKSFRHQGRKIVLITLGGVSFKPSFLNLLEEYNTFFFVFCGQQSTHYLNKNVLLLDRNTSLYHPDLINCADIVVFKSGYSTLAECYQAGKATLCVQRQGFAESPVIEAFTARYLPSMIISQADFTSGRWLTLLPEITPHQTQYPVKENGADVVAEFLLTLL